MAFGYCPSKCSLSSVGVYGLVESMTKSLSLGGVGCMGGVDSWGRLLLTEHLWG